MCIWRWIGGPVAITHEPHTWTTHSFIQSYTQKQTLVLLCLRFFSLWYSLNLLLVGFGWLPACLYIHIRLLANFVSSLAFTLKKTPNEKKKIWFVSSFNDFGFLILWLYVRTDGTSIQSTQIFVKASEFVLNAVIDDRLCDAVRKGRRMVNKRSIIFCILIQSHENWQVIGIHLDEDMVHIFAILCFFYIFSGQSMFGQLEYLMNYFGIECVYSRESAIYCYCAYGHTHEYYMDNGYIPIYHSIHVPVVYMNNIHVHRAHNRQSHTHTTITLARRNVPSRPRRLIEFLFHNIK